MSNVVPMLRVAHAYTAHQAWEIARSRAMEAWAEYLATKPGEDAVADEMCSFRSAMRRAAEAAAE